MDVTPRLRPGRYPQTPTTEPRGDGGSGGGGGGNATSSSSSPRPPRPSANSTRSVIGPSPPSSSPPPNRVAGALHTPTPTRRSAPLPPAPEDKPSHEVRGPVIPLTFLDGPTQRAYAVGLYGVLVLWRFLDWMRLGSDFESSWFLFLKWVLLDLIFLFGLPELRIPWLELSQTAVLLAFTVHAVFTYMLMFNVPIPFTAFLLGLARAFWDREMSVSEHNVKISNIIHNHSLIMGKQIINILPEGSAAMNPDGLPFCLDGKDRKLASIPLHFNSSVPVEIEILRVDLETNTEETLRLSKSDVKKIARKLSEENAESQTAAVTWEYHTKKPGVYRLGKVLDEYRLEVQRQTRDTYVVPCPRAAIKSTPSANRCVRDLSDLSLEVAGTPPLKIVYSRMINGKDHSFHIQSLQPESFVSPLAGPPMQSLVADGADGSWAAPSVVTVPLNESMNTVGEWRYAVDEVHDALGNVVKYAPDEADVDLGHPLGLEQTFHVKERPLVRLSNCDLRRPLEVARGRPAQLPVEVTLGRSSVSAPYRLTWDFSPVDTLTDDGEHGKAVQVGSHVGQNRQDWPRIQEPGLYTLRTISNNHCEGEVQEPSSCLLRNPLEPQMSLTAEDIPDKCAGSSIGLRVDLSLVGKPPFVVRYTVYREGDPDPWRERVEISGLRHQLELIPQLAGRHKYVFTHIDDAIYKSMPLSGPGMVLEQDVKPAAAAFIQYPFQAKGACLDDEVEVDILTLGDGPFTLEWEIFYDGKRQAEKATGIEGEAFKIRTAPLTKGGEYILTLGSIQDRSGCRSFLNDQLKIVVRRQRPRAGFGPVEGRRSITGVEGTAFRLPLRLQGEPEWIVSYRNLNEPDRIFQKTATGANDYIETKERGTWEILGVEDYKCPGTVDQQATTFETGWWPKPRLSLVESESLATAEKGLILSGADPAVFEKRDICEGDADGFEVTLSGSPPFHVNYEVKHKPAHGSGSIGRKEFDAALGKTSVALDSSKPGQYTYTFTGLSDNLYDSDRSSSPVSLRQRVNAKPSASFVKPGRSFKYCQLEQDNEDGSDGIPMTLDGVPPFHVEIEIKHHSGTTPDTYSIASIDSHAHNVRIPRENLRLGSQQVRVRNVRDARGCQQRYDVGAPAVQVHLYDAPAIYPLETRTDYCVGERIAYTLSGTPPFAVDYVFDGPRRAHVRTTDFRRVADKPGVFTVTRVSDKASECAAPVGISRVIHPLPSVRVSRGRQNRVDIHEGNEVDILFEFGGTPPFEFTYTRSTNERKNQRSVVLETRHDVSYEHSKVIRASQEGTYEVVAIKDKYCAFSTHAVAEVRKMLE